MAYDKNDRVAGMVFGSLVADALALGAHWIYDQAELEKKCGRVTDFRKPLADSYHPSKEAGEQTHYGDQALVLLDSLAATGGYDKADFAERWRKSWENYPDYFDHATKDTLANLKKGVPAGEAASHSEELGGATRLAPLLAAMDGQPLEAQIDAARGQTGLTHASPIALDAAEFLTRVVEGILAGQKIWPAVEQAATADYAMLNVQEMLLNVSEASSLEVKAAADKLGQACPTDQALPTVLVLLARYPDDLETAFVENVMAGGDSAARGLALGMILGARHGKAGIPARWIEELRAKAKIEAFLAGLA